MKRSACLIFNPVAGQSNPETDLFKIRTLLDQEIDLDIHMTTPEVDANQLAREAVDRGVELIIASGGDGTLSAAAEAVVQTQIPLGIISRGTANAFASALGIPDTIEAACQTILDGTQKVIDAAICNGKPMVLLAGIGFEAELVKKADRETKNRFGMLAYLLAGLQELREFDTFEVKIETDDRVITLAAAAVTIANAAPPTSILAQGPAGIIYDDGLLDVTVVAPQTRTGVIAASYHLLQTALQGEATDRDDIGYLRAKNLKISTVPPQKVVVDGEIVGTTPIDIDCLPGALTIMVPASQALPPPERLQGLPGLVVESKQADDLS
ncbi:MAG: YegS/Rv2252/BmrU family lipid kinase [Kastovskya adunca ATA6-11-RM4]|jgi:YegS/Rv2252/BmrU family lipid kinase|nr:YegS/Rv2252/BmrU family lipid kinase [Kastovskya adunca ATA6-11-RM4]